MAKYKDLTLGQIEALVNKMGGIEVALDFLRGEYNLTKFVKKTINFTYSMSLSEMLEHCNFGEVEEVIQKISIEGQGEVLLPQLYLVGRFAKMEEVSEELDKVGFRPANLAELLLLAANSPNEQEKYPIVALGSKIEVEGEDHFPILPQKAFPFTGPLFPKHIGAWSQKFSAQNFWRFAVVNK